MDVIAATFLAPLMGMDQRFMGELGRPLAVHYWRWTNQSAGREVWTSLRPETPVFAGNSGPI